MSDQDWPSESERALEAGFLKQQCESCGGYSRNVVEGLCFGCRDGHKDPAYLAELARMQESAIALLKAKVEASPKARAARAEAERTVAAMRADKKSWARKVREHSERDPI